MAAKSVLKIRFGNEDSYLNCNLSPHKARAVTDKGVKNGRSMMGELCYKLDSELCGSSAVRARELEKHVVGTLEQQLCRASLLHFSAPVFAPRVHNGTHHVGSTGVRVSAEPSKRTSIHALPNAARASRRGKR